MTERAAIAVVGAGPAGLYAAAELLRRPDVTVAQFDSQVTPGGLVRFGVAPDHHPRRQVTHVYERLLQGSHRWAYYGNVTVGQHVRHDELLRHFSAVVYATGAARDARLDIPGEDLPGSHSATDVVRWYNAHPAAAGMPVDLSCERAVVIGNGNVALDVARVLLSPPAALARTDIADHAREALAASRIRHVTVLGRRGPAEAAFTLPELLELAHLDDVQVAVEAPAASLLHDGSTPHPLRVRTLRLLADRPQVQVGRTLSLRFFVSPTKIDGRDKVEAVHTVSNELVTQPDGTTVARPTGQRAVLECGLVLRAVGYRADPVAGLPFDHATGTVVHLGGRVVAQDGHEPVQGVYVTGWLKRGPSGVIGSNKFCARETVTQLLADLDSGRLTRKALTQAFDALVEDRQPRRVDYLGWRRLDQHEQAVGASQARPRVKVAVLEQQLEHALRPLVGLAHQDRQPTDPMRTAHTVSSTRPGRPGGAAVPVRRWP